MSFESDEGSNPDSGEEEQIKYKDKVKREKEAFRRKVRNNFRQIKSIMRESSQEFAGRRKWNELTNVITLPENQNVHKQVVQVMRRYYSASEERRSVKRHPRRTYHKKNLVNIAMKRSDTMRRKDSQGNFRSILSDNSVENSMQEEEDGDLTSKSKTENQASTKVESQIGDIQLSLFSSKTKLTKSPSKTKARLSPRKSIQRSTQKGSKNFLTNLDRSNSVEPRKSKLKRPAFITMKSVKVSQNFRDRYKNHISYKHEYYRKNGQNSLWKEYGFPSQHETSSLSQTAFSS